MRRVLCASCVLVLLVVVVSAQPPRPVSPPVAPPVLPPAAPGDPVPLKPPAPFPKTGVPTPATPPAPNEPLLTKFEPLAAYPPVTQFAVRGVLLGSSWMAKLHQPHGRFLHGYNPALRQPLQGEYDLKQAHISLAMAQAAKFNGDQKHAAIASQTILALLAATKIDPTEPNCRVPVQASVVCNRVGFAAILVLAIYALPAPGDALIEDAERLCAFLRTQLRADGSVHYTDGLNDVSPQIDPAGVNQYPGFALHALAVSNRVRPAEWKKDAVKKGLAHYHAVFRAKPHPMLAATLTPAACELYLQTKLNEAATTAFDLNDWLCALQISATDPRTPQWAGGFRTVVNGHATHDAPTVADTSLCVQSLACAYHLTRATADLTREAKYRPVVTTAVEFLCGMQFLEANTRHFENSFRASMLIGGFHLSPTDGNLHTDTTARATTALLRFLSCGAEKGGP